MISGEWLSGVRALSLGADHLNTPQLITDQNQQAVWRWDQTEPFGNNPADEDPDTNSVAFDLPLRLPGQYFDKETNLSYNYWRDFDGALGRYIESDQFGLAGGINTYAYVDSNPLIWFDPDGAAKEKYQKPPNPNQRKGAQDRKPSGDRERNVKHPKGEEHSIKPKGGFKIRGCIPLLIWDTVNEYCRENPWAIECIIMSPADPNEI